jgi:hypothetical protein
MKIVNKTSVGQRRVYDIEVEDVHNFYANGINVHNCATDGGVSVMKDDGTVVDITGPTQAILHVSFNSDEELIATGNFQDQYFVYSLPPSDIAYNNGTYLKRFYTFVSTPALMGGVPNDLINAHVASNEGLTRFAENTTTPSEGMVAYTTSTYNTGWMPGDIKLAALSDTDDTNLVGGELVTNGTFDTDSDWTKGTGWTIGSGVASCDGTQTDYSTLQQLFALDTTKTYIVDIDFTRSAGQIFLRFGSTSSTGNIAILSASGSYRYTVSPTATGGLTVFADANFFGTVDNISVKLADPSRSV